MTDDKIREAVDRLAQVSYLGRAWAELDRVEAEVGPIPRRKLRRLVRHCKLVTATSTRGEELVRLFVPRRATPPSPPRPTPRRHPPIYGLEGLELAEELADRDLDGALFVLHVASRDRTSIRLGTERWAQVRLLERIAPWSAPLLRDAARARLVEISAWTSPGGRFVSLARPAPTDQKKTRDL